MISGFDTIIVAVGSPTLPIISFLDGMALRWPGMRVLLDEPVHEQFEPWARVRDALSPEVGEMLISRDESMEATWDEKGYSLVDGEGPLALYYRRFQARTGLITFLEDPYERTGSAFDPYDGVLVGRNLWLVTVVTPDEDSPFSRSVIEALLSSLG